MIGAPFNPNQTCFLLNQALNSNQFNPNVPNTKNLVPHNLLWDFIENKLQWVRTIDGIIVQELSGDGGDVIIANTAFVAENGDDGTAIIGNLNKPFLTIEAAHAAAVAGTSIYVFAGNYTISTGLYKTEVVGYHFEPGVNINSTATWMFNGLISGTALNLNVTGGAIITCLGGFIRSPEGVGSNNINVEIASLTWNTNAVFIFSNVGSKVSLKATRSIIGGAFAGLSFIAAPDTLLEITTPYVLTALGNIIQGGSGSESVLNVAEYEVNGITAVASQGQLDTAGSKIVFNCGIMNIAQLNNNVQGVFFTQGTGGTIEINSEINHTAGQALARLETGEIHFNKPIASAFGFIYAQAGGAKVYINSNFITGTSTFFGSVLTEAGTYVFIGPYLIRNTANLPTIFNSGGGNVALSGTRLITDTALVPPIDNSGTLQIAGEVLQNQASVGAAPVSGILTTLPGVF